LGALCVVREQEAPFDPDEIRSLTLLANAAAIAITNARLTASARQEAGRAAASAEREQLAAELHDHLAQTLSFLNLKTDQLQGLFVTGARDEGIRELMHMKSAIETAYAQVRTALTGLRQPPPDAADLAEKLAAAVAEFRIASGVAAQFFVADPTALALQPTAQPQILHIVREALTNVRRHAQAQQVQVRVNRSKGTATFVVEDNGRGFDPQARMGDHHMGLMIMRTRAERSGGQLLIDSAPGSGTKIVVHLPLAGQTGQKENG
jgi:two-component system nitrate/nitrite sensor histidine kinase NarX